MVTNNVESPTLQNGSCMCRLCPLGEEMFGTAYCKSLSQANEIFKRGSGALLESWLVIAGETGDSGEGK